MAKARYKLILHQFTGGRFDYNNLTTPFDASVRPIWEVIEEIGASVPSAEWDKVPRDGATNLDHYLYGHPKKAR